MVKKVYAVWIKVDSTLPWIELKRAYQTRKEARKAAQDFLNSMQIRIVTIPETEKKVRPLATIRR
jgi:hypothetical protein